MIPATGRVQLFEQERQLWNLSKHQTFFANERRRSGVRNAHESRQWPVLRETVAQTIAATAVLLASLKSSL